MLVCFALRMHCSTSSLAYHNKWGLRITSICSIIVWSCVYIPMMVLWVYRYRKLRSTVALQKRYFRATMLFAVAYIATIVTLCCYALTQFTLRSPVSSALGVFEVFYYIFSQVAIYTQLFRAWMLFYDIRSVCSFVNVQFIRVFACELL